VAQKQSSSNKISLMDASGKLISGRFEVSRGIITVKASSGRSKTADVSQSMLDTETLAKSLLLLLDQERRRTTEPSP
jgi:hypothetical protein